MMQINIKWPDWEMNQSVGGNRSRRHRTFLTEKQVNIDAIKHYVRGH